MDSNACTRFLLFLQSKNITDPAFITPEIIKDYHAKAQHRTPARQERLHPQNPRLYQVPGQQKTRATDTGTCFYDRKSAKSSHRYHVVRATGQFHQSLWRERPFTLRNSEAPRWPCWRFEWVYGPSISAIFASLTSRGSPGPYQLFSKKRGVPLTLPFPVEVGNLLAKYLLEGRPRCDEPNVFISLKHPYTRLTPPSCYHSSLRILGRKESAADVRGLHVARKTFASNLLTAGNPVSTICFHTGAYG